MKPRPEWFQKNAAFDQEISARFLGLVKEACDAGLAEWEAHSDGALALILLLDQFARNIWRDTPQAFAGDARALVLAQALLDARQDKAMTAVERQFAYMPFMHAEDLAMQKQCVQLFTDLAAADPSQAGALEFAIRHRDIIARFGRFPHRNQQLARASTGEELAFLATPGSGF